MSAVVRLRNLFLIVLPFFLVLSCGSPAIGYGVLLWAPDDSGLTSGDVVTVNAESEISDSYSVVADGQSDQIEIPRWRVEFYETRDAAGQRAAEYSAVFDGKTTLRARATRNALPIRSEPEATSTNSVYRLRENEEVKLIGRQEEEVDLQGLISYWYEALTQTGERGWVFGYTLDIYDPTDPAFVMDSGRTEDPRIDQLLSNIWRPVSYVNMIANGTIDLDTFRVEYGLFPDPATRTFELVLPAHAVLFEYERITRVGQGRYIAEGTPLAFTFQRGNEISVQYSFQGEQYVIAMQVIDTPIQDYIDAEIERRAKVYAEIQELGPNFRSDNYGSLTFEDEQRFTWGGYDRLVPNAIPAGASNSGRVGLNLFLARSLESQFDGAVSFEFAGTSRPVSFAYSLEPTGIRLIWIPEGDIDDRLVTRVGPTTLTVFMSASGS
jgi:hypothetical protein